MQKLKKIKLIIMDVDGVLTDGKIIIDDNGLEHKVFNIKDGTSIRLAQLVGLSFAIISGRKSKAVQTRAKDLNIDLTFLGYNSKNLVIKQLREKLSLKKEEILFIGDDFVDMLAFEEVGCKIATADACQEIKDKADYVLKNKGGNGAVRELVQKLLKAQNKWEKALEKYLDRARKG